MLGNRCLDHTEKPPFRPTDYVIRHILHVSRPNRNVGSEWRKSTRIIDRISQQGNSAARRVPTTPIQCAPAPRPGPWRAHPPTVASRQVDSRRKSRLGLVVDIYFQSISRQIFQVQQLRLYLAVPSPTKNDRQAWLCADAAKIHVEGGGSPGAFPSSHRGP
jgi:hypothetical protein